MSSQLQIGLFDVCARKHGGNKQSVVANLRIEPHKQTRRERIYARLILAGTHGMTTKELAQVEGLELHKVSGRASELLAMERIYRTNAVRDNGSVLVADIFWKRAGHETEERR
jgi:DNA-binding CsgD family transcriptional regulator